MTRIFTLNCLALLLFFQTVSAESFEVMPGYSTDRINDILAGAGPGDTIHFQPGTYTGPFLLNGVQGEPNKPVVISGSPSEPGTVVIDGKTAPGMSKKNNAFALEDCSWVVIEGFTIRNCWTDIITANKVSWFSLKSCRITGGKRVVFATDRRSHHFLIEKCNWEQDERVWTHEEDYTWEELHHGIHRHYNGSIFQGYLISGVFVIRDNYIRNTFNAFRLSQIGDNETDLLACSNGEVYRNRIHNTSDNVLEPEVYCHNLHFYHNRMVNGHAFISVDQVGGGPIYLYGNTGLSEPDCEDGWTIYKLRNERRTLSRPFYVFNNSWYVDYPFAGRFEKWRNTNTLHFNNAYFIEKQDTFGLYTPGINNSFDYDCSNLPFPAYFDSAGIELSGIEADPGFVDPLKDDFRLAANSPCIDRGRQHDELILSFEGDSPDIGAWEGNRLVEGPPFRYSEPEMEVPYVEHARITRYKTEGKQLTLWFSMPFNPDALREAGFTINSGGDNIVPLTLIELDSEGYRALFRANKDITSDSKPRLILQNWPKGLNGKRLTSWASDIEVKVEL